jgi:hypothetical protein
MKKLILTLVIVFSVNFLFSQEADPSIILLEKLQPGSIMPDANSGIEFTGTPYLDSIFFNGAFQIEKTKYLSPMRYNIFLDAFEVKQGNNIVYINSHAVDTIYCNNSTFIYKKDGKRLTVFEVLSTKANTELLKQYKVSYKEGKLGNPKKKNKYPSFKSEKPVYFICSTEKGILKLNAIKGFRKIYPEKKEAINAFIKENKLKQDNENSLITLFNFVATLPISPEGETVTVDHIKQQ